MMRMNLFSLFLSLLSFPAFAQTNAATEPILPPLSPWEGKSRSLVVAKNDPWITPSEASGFTRTPRYDETMAWLQRLAQAAPELKMISLGKSAEGRDLWMVIASKEKSFTPEAMRKSGKPILFAQGGIHAGEIDGKDAGMMLLRDMTVRGNRKQLLDGVNLLFLPIFNVDGHERFSRFTRINQRGPIESGWRTTARNLNLNRDYAKLDTLEMRALVAVLHRWEPHLYVDLHVTDGADYQYDITWGYTGTWGHSPSGARWLAETMTPILERDLTAMGHIPGSTAVAGFNPANPSEGIVDWTSDPRFSNGYGDARHIPSVLVENHSLKPYDQRVLGTYVLLESMMRTLSSHGAALKKAINDDRNQRRDPVPLAWAVGNDAPVTIPFKAIEARMDISPISGNVEPLWTGRPYTVSLPMRRMSKAEIVARRPVAYWIPSGWPDVIDRLVSHGIRVDRISEPRQVDVEVDRFSDIKLDAQPFEGHVRVTASAKPERRRETFPTGSVRVPTDQPLGTLAVLLLEPQSPDSFFQWGFFYEILGRTEYVEAYIMEPMARKMMEEDPVLAAEFKKKLLEDRSFRANAQERLQWFYERTPFLDERWRLYPVGREVRP